MANLPLPALETLRDIVQAAFPGRYGLEELNRIVAVPLGYDMFAEFGGGDIALFRMARLLLVRTEQDGATAKLVETLLLARPGNRALRDWTQAYLPELATLVSLEAHQQALVSNVKEGVAALQELAADPAVRARLDRSRVNLSQVAIELVRVALFKGLHDTLHRVQVPLYRAIGDTLRDFPAQDACVDALALYTSQLETLALDARSALDEVPEGDECPADEEIWIVQLEAVAGRFDQATLARDAALARRALMELKAVLRSQPPRLDALLVQAARRIPTASLIETMTVVAGRLAPNDNLRRVLTEAAEALDLLRTEVNVRVEEHEAWQRIETSFWLTEEAIQRADADSLSEFSALWPLLSNQIGALCGGASTDGWVADLQRSASEFVSLCPQPVVPPVDPAARAAFARYVTAGRLRFYRVDTELKGRCRNVIQLSKPLRDLLSGV